MISNALLDHASLHFEDQEKAIAKRFPNKRGSQAAGAGRHDPFYSHLLLLLRKRQYSPMIDRKHELDLGETLSNMRCNYT